MQCLSPFSHLLYARRDIRLAREVRNEPRSENSIVRISLELFAQAFECAPVLYVTKATVRKALTAPSCPRYKKQQCEMCFHFEWPKRLRLILTFTHFRLRRARSRWIERGISA